MPSVSKKQRNFMAAAAHNPAFAKKVGIPVSVAKEFNQADKGKKFKGGGMAKKEMMHEEKGEMKADIAQDKKLIKKAFGMHDKQEHPGKKTNLSALKSGGRIASKGEHPVQKQSKRGAMEVKMCGGGKVKRYEEGGDVEGPTNENTPTAASMKEESFGDAFKRARRNGEKTFEFKGKTYTTETADDNKFSNKAKKAGFTSAETKGGAALMTRKMKSGGSVSSASKRADGCAIRGKTRA